MRLYATAGSESDILAEYLWGSSTLVLNPHSELARGLFAKAVAGLGQHVLPVSTDKEFKGLVAVFHELSHCIQDMCTGVGFSDWYTRHRLLHDVLYQGRNASWGLDSSTALDALRDRYRSESFVNASGWGKDTEIGLLREKLKGVVTDGSEGLFRCTTLLELDATLATSRAIHGLFMSDTQRELVGQHHNLFSVMTSPYLQTYLTLVKTFGLSESTPPDAATRILENTEVIGPMLLDIAFAVPPPEYMRARGLDPHDFHPGVRLVRMLSTMSEQDDQNVPAAGSEHMQYYRWFNETCRKTRWCHYPPVEEIFQAWIDELAPLATDKYCDSRVRWIQGLCKRRIALGYPVWDRSASVVLQLEIPFFTRIGEDDQPHVIVFGSTLTAEGQQLAAESTMHNVNDSVMHYILGLQPVFVCPRADRDKAQCSAQVQSCLEGIDRLSSTPAAPECLVHRQLERATWNDRTLSRPENAPPWA
jgi:hypothetical protein